MARELTNMKTKLLIAIAILALLGGCTDASTAQRVLHQQGYTNVVITGYRPFLGSQGDTYVTGFEATAPNGTRVTGAVCSGFLKGATIRFD